MKGDQFPIFIVLIPMLSAFVVPLAGSIRKGNAFWLMLFALGGAFACSLGSLIEVLRTGTIHYWVGGWAPPWGIEIVVDHLSVYMALLVSGVTAYGILCQACAGEGYYEPAQLALPTLRSDHWVSRARAPVSETGWRTLRPA